MLTEETEVGAHALKNKITKYESDFSSEHLLPVCRHHRRRRRCLYANDTAEAILITYKCAPEI